MVKHALHLTAPGAFEIIELPVEPPADDEVVVEVEAVNTCPQWDMHLWRNEPMFAGGSLDFPYTPGQPGHEMVGRVIETGRGVTTLRAGERVAAWRDPGHDIHGSYATHVTRKAEFLLPMPDDLPATACASLELAMCIASIFLDLKRHNFLPCRSLGVAGLGGAGLIAMQMAKAVGVERVVGIDTDASRRAYTEKLGYGETFDPAEKDALPARHEDGALDIAIECVGHQSAFDCLAERTRSIVALFGVQREDYAYRLAYAGPPLIVWGYPGHFRESAEFARELILAGKVDLVPLATHTLPLRDYAAAVELLLSRKAIKVCLLCDAASVAP